MTLSYRSFEQLGHEFQTTIMVEWRVILLSKFHEYVCLMQVATYSTVQFDDCRVPDQCSGVAAKVHPGQKFRRFQHRIRYLLDII